MAYWQCGVYSGYDVMFTLWFQITILSIMCFGHSCGLTRLGSENTLSFYSDGAASKSSNRTTNQTLEIDPMILYTKSFGDCARRCYGIPNCRDFIIYKAGGFQDYVMCGFGYNASDADKIHDSTFKGGAYFEIENRTSEHGDNLCQTFVHLNDTPAESRTLSVHGTSSGDCHLAVGTGSGHKIKVHLSCNGSCDGEEFWTIHNAMRHPLQSTEEPVTVCVTATNQISNYIFVSGTKGYLVFNAHHFNTTKSSYNLEFTVVPKEYRCVDCLDLDSTCLPSAGVCSTCNIGDKDFHARCSNATRKVDNITSSQTTAPILPSSSSWSLVPTTASTGQRNAVTLNHHRNHPNIDFDSNSKEPVQHPTSTHVHATRVTATHRPTSASTPGTNTHVHPTTAVLSQTSTDLYSPESILNLTATTWNPTDSRLNSINTTPNPTDSRLNSINTTPNPTDSGLNSINTTPNPTDSHLNSITTTLNQISTNMKSTSTVLEPFSTITHSPSTIPQEAPNANAPAVLPTATSFFHTSLSPDNSSGKVINQINTTEHQTSSGNSSGKAMDQINTTRHQTSSDDTAVIGGAVGGTVAGVLFLSLIGFLLYRRWKKMKIKVDPRPYETTDVEEIAMEDATSGAGKPPQLH